MSMTMMASTQAKTLYFLGSVTYPYSRNVCIIGCTALLKNICSLKQMLRFNHSVQRVSEIHHKRKTSLPKQRLLMNETNFYGCKNYHTGCFFFNKNNDVITSASGNSFDSDELKKDPDLWNILKEIRSDFEQKEPYNKEVSKESSEIWKEDYAYYEVAEDIEEYDYKDENEMQPQQIRSEKVLPISLERGKEGVFDLEELLICLDDLGAENVVTVPVPKEANFCDYMIVASAKSTRHMRAIHDEMKWIHKRKKYRKDSHLIISGEDNKDWSAMDLGNIVLHLFYGTAREYYDIETLWQLGPENDPKTQEYDANKYVLSAEDLFWLETAQSDDKMDGLVKEDSPKDQSTPELSRKDTITQGSKHTLSDEDAGWGKHNPT